MQKSFPRLNFGRKKARMVRAHWRLTMDYSQEAVIFGLVMGGCFFIGTLFESWRSFVAKEASDAMRPLLSEDDWAVMRPGDTVLIMLKMDQMTKDEQQRMTQAVAQIMVRAQVRGVEVIALPARKGDQAVVVSRSKKGGDGGQSGDDCASQREPAGGQVAAQPMA